MKFGYLILYVEDVPQALAFYEQAFGLERGMVAETNEYGELLTGECKLAFAASSFVETSIPGSFERARVGGRAPPMEVGLVAIDVEGAYAKAVAAGALPVKAPERKPWGQLVGYVRDNNGFLVEICSPMK